VGQAFPPASFDFNGSERRSQCELDDAWQIVLRGDLSEGSATATTGIRRIELHSIKGIEKLRPELQAKPFVVPELGVFKERKIEVLDSVVL
jgi:hypothetical protein